jgi:modification methylase
MINIYNEDCLAAMRLMPDKSFDICITSPPYNLGKKHHTGNKIFTPYPDDLEETEYQENQIAVLNEVYRLLKDNGSLFYNHKNRISKGVTISPYSWIFKTNFKIKQEIVWINGSQNFDKCRFYPMTERIYWLSKNTETEFVNNAGLKDYNNWQPEGTDKLHKRAYPVVLVKSILSCFNSGLSVLDPYLGSGTTAIACHDYGFSLTGYELDTEYYNSAMKRIKEHQSQGKLF